ncbi:MAG: hypothetical protein C0485_10315 [Pirellula sp.]|nr:hypothetical protein [Pirellula sp.]
MVGGGLNAARSVGGSVVNRASQGVGAARSAARSVARRGTDVARVTASRSVGVARSAASQGAVVARSAASRGVGAAQNVTARGVGVAQNVGARGVIAAGSAVNRARLAQNTVQNRLNVGGALQNAAGAGGNGAVAAGVARFAGATQIAAGAPQGIVAGNGVRVEQLKAGVANRTQGALNAVAAIPPRVVGEVGRVAQATGLPTLPPRLKQAVDNAAALPQLAANIPVGAIVKLKVREVGAAAGQGQVINNVATAGQQALTGNGLAGDALNVAQEIQQTATNPANGVATDGGVIDAALAANDLAVGIVETVEAAQHDLSAVAALPIPTGVRSIIANRPVNGGGTAASAPSIDYAAADYASEEYFGADAAPSEDTPAETFVAELSNADLVLEDMQLSAHATAIAGPAYRVQFRNQGSSAASDFYVVLLAGVGANPAEDAPRAVFHVANVAPGEAMEAILRLPAAAMQVVDANGDRTEMTHAFVSLDFTDAIAEVDETNNLAIIEVTALTTAMQ